MKLPNKINLLGSVEECIDQLEIAHNKLLNYLASKEKESLNRVNSRPEIKAMEEFCKEKENKSICPFPQGNEKCTNGRDTYHQFNIREFGTCYYCKSKKESEPEITAEYGTEFIGNGKFVGKVTQVSEPEEKCYICQPNTYELKSNGILPVCKKHLAKPEEIECIGCDAGCCPCKLHNSTPSKSPLEILKEKIERLHSEHRCLKVVLDWIDELSN